MKKKLTYLTLILVGALFFSKNALADDQNFSISPFFQEINLEKEQERTDFVLEIANNTGAAATLKLSVLDFGALDESGGVAFLGSAEDLKNKYALASWVSLEKDSVVINPGEKQNVRVMIENKDSLSPGGHYAAVMANMAKEDDGTGSESSIVALDPSFASLIFVRKVGGEIYGLNLKDQEIEKNFLSLPSNVRLRFQNTGNVHVSPRGIIKLTDPLGREIATGIINGESAIVLPETFRKFPTEFKQAAVAFMPGKYELSVAYRFDGKEDFVTQQQVVYFFPIKIMLASIFMLVLVAFSWRRFRRRR
ncbi:MAG: hypothetical protein HGA36_01235 [Candidatus Moranbacteria bacterium]|nr:hypothetical protein [Candidatus Moranbacteria bacterium]